MPRIVSNASLRTEQHSALHDSAKSTSCQVFSKKHDAEAALRECKLMDHSWSLSRGSE